jgi:hypothetical protein
MSFVTHEFCNVSVIQNACVTKTWDTHVIVKMVKDKYVSVIQNSCVTKTWDTHVIVKMVSDFCDT